MSKPKPVKVVSNAAPASPPSSTPASGVAWQRLKMVDDSPLLQGPLVLCSSRLPRQLIDQLDAKAAARNATLAAQAAHLGSRRKVFWTRQQELILAVKLYLDQAG